MQPFAIRLFALVLLPTVLSNPVNQAVVGQNPQQVVNPGAIIEGIIGPGSAGQVGSGIDTVRGGLGILTDGLRQIGVGVGSGVDNARQVFRNGFQQVVQSMPAVQQIVGGVREIAGGVRRVGGGVGQGINRVGTGIGSGLDNVVNGVRTGITNVANEVGANIDQVRNNVENALITIAQEQPVRSEIFRRFRNFQSRIRGFLDAPVENPAF